MTREELMALSHLNISEITRFVHLHTEEGWFLTDYFEGMDIKEFCYTNCLYLPIKDEYNAYRVIDEVEMAMLEERAEEARREEEAELMTAAEETDEEPKERTAEGRLGDE